MGLGGKLLSAELQTVCNKQPIYFRAETFIDPGTFLSRENRLPAAARNWQKRFGLPTGRTAKKKKNGPDQ